MFIVEDVKSREVVKSVTVEVEKCSGQVGILVIFWENVRERVVVWHLGGRRCLLGTTASYD